MLSQGKQRLLYEEQIEVEIFPYMGQMYIMLNQDKNDLFRPVKWVGGFAEGYLWMLDQRRLPLEFEVLQLMDHRAIADAIRQMAVRGAPAIGVTAAFGVVVAFREAMLLPPEKREAFFLRARKRLEKTRPTAVNLFWSLARMFSSYSALKGAFEHENGEALLIEALSIQAEDTEANITMGEKGAQLLPLNARVLTHCNAGALATSAYGTALGVVRSGYASGRVSRVYADETRPFLQGARLTAWELKRDGIPVTLITDSMAGHLMQRGEIDVVVVGSDRIAANGDVANKIGTYTVAVLAQAHKIPFIVAAPTSTIDLKAATGMDIPIEERAADEVTHIGSHKIAPDGIEVLNPAFDITPAELVTAIVTEKGIAEPPSLESIKALFK
jgi:methylthioribose-1-phosphate isomerase